MNDQILRIKGLVLSSVEFVHDYVQLRFDGPCLTINAPFKLFVFGRAYEKGTFGYRDAICERIGHGVEFAATIGDKCLRIEFDDKTILEISLKHEDQMGPESAMLTDNNFVAVW